MRCDNVIVTTSHKNSPELHLAAKELASRLKLPYTGRDDLSIVDLCSARGASGAVVVSAGKVSFVAGNQEFCFHPGLAILRINELNNGKNDKMIEAMDLKHGFKVLDCTLGLGTDAIVASYVAGAEGRVVGLEKSPLIAAIVGCGLAHYRTGDENIDLAMRRIEVIAADHREYLAGAHPGSFDVIYFDPMFRRPRHRSSAINAMRGLAAPDPIQPDAVVRAVQVAARRIVVKERRGSGEHARLGLNKIYGRKYAPVAYGVLEGLGGNQGESFSW